jgi:Nucleotide modification associated domain 3
MLDKPRRLVAVGSPFGETENDMQVVLLRVGIDTGSGGIHGPLFKNGSFEYVPIRDGFNGSGISDQTYGNTLARYGNRMLVHYFPEKIRESRRNIPIHHDPEFQTFTYGDPTPPKHGLRKLQKGDLLVFYAGLQGWNFQCAPALYIVGFFEVETAGLATDFSQRDLHKYFGRNFHVWHRSVFRKQKNRLILVKGNKRSRLLKRARLISSVGADVRGRPLHILSPEMQKIFGDFDGHVSIQRSPPRWVAEKYCAKASAFVYLLH